MPILLVISSPIQFRRIFHRGAPINPFRDPHGPCEDHQNRQFSDKTSKSSRQDRTSYFPCNYQVRVRKPVKTAGKDKISERVAAATEQLASGLTQASAAAEELRRSMEQISSGAEEAAGASQEQLAAIKQIATNLAIARTEADTSRRRTEAAQVLLAESATQIGARCKRSRRIPNARSHPETSSVNWSAARRT